MEFSVLLVVILAVVSTERLPREVTDAAFPRALLAFSGGLIISLLVCRGAMLLVKQVRSGVLTRSEAARSCRLLRGTFAVVSVIAAFWVLAWVRWPQVVRYNWGLDGWVLLDELLVLLPLLLPFVISWAALHAVDVVVNADRGAEKSANESARRVSFQYFPVSTRYYFGLFVVPYLLVAGVQDVLAWTMDDGRAAAWHWMAGVVPLGMLVLSYPLILRRLWSLQPLPDGSLRRQLLANVESEPFAAREVLLWRTDGAVANAAIVGLVPWSRLALVTDGLLGVLTTDEILAVLRHETGHIRRHHLLLRMLVVGLPLWLWFAGHSLQPEWFARIGTVWSAMGGSAAWPVACAALVVYLCVALAWFSRFQEHDADLWACFADRTPNSDQRLTHLIAALEKLASHPRERKSSSWLHPTVERRIAVLRQASQDPRSWKFRSRLHDGCGASLIAAYVVIPLLLLPL